MFLFAAEQMGVPAERCVVIEDSPSGVEAALAAGMGCLAYASGLVDEALLSHSGVTIVQRMDEVVGVIDSRG